MDPLFDEEDRRTFDEAVQTWGLEAQIDMAVEECAELIVALQQYQRGRADLHDVFEELADVRIMYEQLSLFFAPAEVEITVGKKMERLRERLENADA